MRLDKVEFYKIIFFACTASLLCADNTSFNSSIFFGIDSNPMRLSDNEINQLDLYPSILGNAEEVESPLLGFKFRLKHKIPKKRITLNFNLKTSYYLLSTDKSNYNFSFNFKKSLNDYRQFIIDYFLLPDFYLREYEDRDLYIVCEDNLDECLLSARFSIEKIKMILIIPIKRKISSVKLGFLHERQLFDENFTEFDLRIVGPIFEYKVNKKNYRYSFLSEYLVADNFTYLDGSLSTMYMDRSYKQQRYRLSFEKGKSKSGKYGIALDVYKRQNTSTLNSDNLHYLRSHTDATVSCWYKFNSHKILISFRERKTKSPYRWVEELKTFKRVNLTYTKYFDTVKF